jgi:ubiquitin C-terminal hydrolase
MQLMLFSSKPSRRSREFINSKKKHRVIIPQLLDLSSYQPTHVVHTDELGNPKLDQRGNEIVVRNTPLKYRLQAVTSHAGASVHNGHYIATVRNRNKMKSNPNKAKAEEVAYMCENNQATIQIPIKELTESPQKLRGTAFQPDVLTYVLVSRG